MRLPILVTFTSAFIEGRQLRENTLMTIRDKDHNILWSKQLRKGHSIVCLTQATGRDPSLYPEPGLLCIGFSTLCLAKESLLIKWTP